ncbi:MAG TPA: ferritin family protein [Candidatus Hypogeohydataceae bacterium YC41]
MILKLMNDDEALRIATSLEKEGFNFYIRAAETASNPKTRRMFHDLAAAEKQHLALFEEVRSKLPKRGGEPWGDEDEMVNRYIQTLIDTGVFTRPAKKEKASKRNLTDEEALKVGIQTEKDSILFYTEAAKLCSNTKGKKMFKSLIEEEKRHLTDLAQHLSRLRKSTSK